MDENNWSGTGPSIEFSSISDNIPTILELLSQGVSRTTIARSIGVSIHNLNLALCGPQIRYQVVQAEGQFNLELEQRVLENILNGATETRTEYAVVNGSRIEIRELEIRKINVKLQLKLLEQRVPEAWGPKGDIFAAMATLIRSGLLNTESTERFQTAFEKFMDGARVPDSLKSSV